MMKPPVLGTSPTTRKRKQSQPMVRQMIHRIPYTTELTIGPQSQPSSGPPPPRWTTLRCQCTGHPPRESAERLNANDLVYRVPPGLPTSLQVPWNGPPQQVP